MALPKKVGKVSFRAQSIAFFRRRFIMTDVTAGRRKAEGLSARCPGAKRTGVSFRRRMNFMRTKRRMVRLMALALLAGALLLPAAQTRAAEKKAGVKTWVKTQVLNSDQKTLYSVDLDGDGKKEHLSLKTKTDKGSGALTEASLTVNGKTALTFKKTQALSMTVDSVRLADGEIYFRVYLTGANDFRELDCFYRYDAGKKRMVKQMELMDSGRSGTAEVKRAKDLDVTVSYKQQFPEIGTVAWKSVYTSEDGKLKLKSTGASVKCVDTRKADFDDYGKLFAKNKLKANTSVKLYADTSLKRTAFTAKKGDVVTLKKIKFTKGHFYVQLVKGDKKGWLMLEEAGKPLFYGVEARLAG